CARSVYYGYDETYFDYW
nr:immunoglobulin heavy chain junction region [Mus musculus]NSM06916.1 immunoglobulin heavy chain junction region [Mus musculus]NSM08342.1 immunoglobulin heavy chain junction region [Mus musculus]NSM09296.1 immunoglobulin heavy chain junction region [Mus musculus]